MLLCIPSTISKARARDQGVVDKQASNHKVAGQPWKGQLCQGRRTAGGQKSRQGSGDKKRGHREALADWDQWVGPDRLLAYD